MPDVATRHTSSETLIKRSFAVNALWCAGMLDTMDITELLSPEEAKVSRTIHRFSGPGEGRRNMVITLRLVGLAKRQIHHVDHTCGFGGVWPLSRRPPEQCFKKNSAILMFCGILRNQVQVGVHRCQALTCVIQKNQGASVKPYKKANHPNVKSKWCSDDRDATDCADCCGYLPRAISGSRDCFSFYPQQNTPNLLVEERNENNKCNEGKREQDNRKTECRFVLSFPLVPKVSGFVQIYFFKGCINGPVEFVDLCVNFRRLRFNAFQTVFSNLLGGLQTADLLLKLGYDSNALSNVRFQTFHAIVREFRWQDWILCNNLGHFKRSQPRICKSDACFKWRAAWSDDLVCQIRIVVPVRSDKADSDGLYCLPLAAVICKYIVKRHKKSGSDVFGYKRSVKLQQSTISVYLWLLQQIGQLVGVDKIAQRVADFLIQWYSISTQPISHRFDEFYMILHDCTLIKGLRLEVPFSVQYSHLEGQKLPKNTFRPDGQFGIRGFIPSSFNCIVQIVIPLSSRPDPRLYRFDAANHTHNHGYLTISTNQRV